MSWPQRPCGAQLARTSIFREDPSSGQCLWPVSRASTCPRSQPRPDLLVLEATPPLEQVKTQQLASEVRGRLLLGSGAARP